MEMNHKGQNFKHATDKLLAPCTISAALLVTTKWAFKTVICRPPIIAVARLISLLAFGTRPAPWRRNVWH
jgi:hypothetical protein